MYPTGCVPPSSMASPRIHKPDTPLRPIVSSYGSVTYGVAKELAKILKCLVGKSSHYINSTQDFVEQAKHIPLAPGECLSSYDVSVLFTSVTSRSAPSTSFKDLLEKDHTLKGRTVMAQLVTIILLLEFCLKNTYFLSKTSSTNRLRVQPWFPQFAPIVANLYMEYLEQKALSTAPTPPRFWHRCVDDTLSHPQGGQQTRLPSNDINSVDSDHKVYSGGQQEGLVHPLLGHH